MRLWKGELESQKQPQGAALKRSTLVSTSQTIGQPVGCTEGPDQVTGAAIYPADVNPLGTLVGQRLRSPDPHARIKPIDVSDDPSVV